MNQNPTSQKPDPRLPKPDPQNPTPQNPTPQNPTPDPQPSTPKTRPPTPDPRPPTPDPQIVPPPKFYIFYKKACKFAKLSSGQTPGNHLKLPCLLIYVQIFIRSVSDVWGLNVCIIYIIQAELVINDFTYGS